MPPSLTRRRTSASKCSVALTPVSAIKSAVSRSSYSCSSIRLPVNTVEMLEPVLRRPSCSLLNQRWRSGATLWAMACSMLMGVTSALPIIELPVLAAVFRGAGEAAAAGAAA